MRVRGGIWVGVEVASGSEACGIWLLLLLLLRILSLCLLNTALCLSREDWVRERGRGSWVGRSVRICLTVVVQVQIKRPAIIVIVHLGSRLRSDRCRETSKKIRRTKSIWSLVCSRFRKKVRRFAFAFEPPMASDLGGNQSWQVAGHCLTGWATGWLGCRCSQTVAQSMCGLQSRMCWFVPGRMAMDGTNKPPRFGTALEAWATTSDPFLHSTTSKSSQHRSPIVTYSSTQ